MFVAEAPGSEEEREGVPLIGPSGQEFRQCCIEAGLDISIARLDNIFHDRPPGNRLDAEWCRSKKIVSEAYIELRPALIKACPSYEWPSTYTWSSLSQGKYILPEHLPELQRLREEILRVKPNLVVALGGKALWALCGRSTIKALRGTSRLSTLVPGQKVLPTWHPAYVQRAYGDRLDLVADLMKAKREMLQPEIHRPHREIWIDPTIEEMYFFYENFIKGQPLLAFDTETAHKQITTVSFAASTDRALVVPFVDKSKPGYCYWPTKALEVLAWRFVWMVLNSGIPLLAQNGLYDMQYFWFKHGIPVTNYAEDTMLLHHSLYIEKKKDLGYLGSIYTDEAAWKLMRTRAKDEQDKKDE